MGRTDKRVTLRGRHPYHTRSNIQKFVRTPGGKLVFHRKRKIGGKVKCGDCKEALHGIPCLRPKEYHRLPRRYKNVSRAYGGSVCATCVRKRVMRAFLMDEARSAKNLHIEAAVMKPEVLPKRKPVVKKKKTVSKKSEKKAVKKAEKKKEVKKAKK